MGGQGQQRPNHPPGFQQQPQEKKPNLEELMSKFLQASETRFQAVETSMRNQEASIHNLEKQIGQLAKAFSEGQQGSLPGNTETNPREHVKAITFRSGKELKVDEEGKKKEAEGVNLRRKGKEP